MHVNKFVKEIQELYLKKQSLMATKDSFAGNLKRAEMYYSNLEKKGDFSKDKIILGLKQTVSDLNNMDALDKEIWDLDVLIMTKLEAYFTDERIAIIKPASTTDAGDRIPASRVTMSSELGEVDDMVEITPDDLFYLKIMKAAFGVPKDANIELIKK